MNDDFLNSKILLNSARNCLRYVVKSFDIKKIAVPYFICPVVRQTLKNDGVEINFYHINNDFLPDCEFQDDDFVLYVNYFGICSRQNEMLAKHYKNLISDNAHAFFAKKKGIASFSSVRKFFNVNDGGILDCDRILAQNFPQDENRNLSVTDFNSFLKNELSIDNQPVKIMSSKTQNFLKNVNFEQKMVKNRQIFAKIDEKLQKMNNLKFDISKDDVPMVYPFLSDDFAMMENISKMLENKGVYIIRYGSDLPKTYPEYDFTKIMMIPLISSVSRIFDEKISFP